MERARDEKTGEDRPGNNKCEGAENKKKEGTVVIWVALPVAFITGCPKQLTKLRISLFSLTHQ
jgi:hypothetical protein